jgi:anti-sigma regulatory factor (Ser/Thr protein kinase)
VACQFILDESELVDSSVSRSEHVDLVGSVRSAGHARDFVRAGLQADTSSAQLDDVLLLTSELVTNAVVHARTDLHLGVTWDGSSVLVTVQDQGPPPDRERVRATVTSDFEEESGRGMAIIAALATDFGWRLLPDGVGKVMWFVLALAASPPRNKSNGNL